ncbi:hypothetical protein AB1L30_10115 [Bremerella sp. JC817]|uniref:hypothetical protein n=1 Tax=Bremerella sp. JC817 TaxID=3231756 RepID=UPI00345772AC
MSGCGTAEPPRLEVFPVKGTLHVNGKPAAHAELTFHRKEPLQDASGRDLFPYAIVQDDGKFAVLTNADGDGAPPGEYAITVVWPKITIEGGEETFGPDMLRGRYRDPGTPVTTIVVTEQDNVIPPINLK